VLINRNYRRLWIGQAVSLVGDEVFDTTLLLWVGTVLLAGRSYAPLASSTVLILTSIVIVLLSPIAGVFVDRWDKRRTMLRADAARAVLIGLLVVVATPGSRLPLGATLTAIAIVVLLATAAAQFFNPARLVIIADVVPGDSLGRASSYGQTAAAVAGVIGPPLAAPLLVGIGVQWAIAINALSFVVSFIAIRAVRVGAVPAQAAAPPIESDLPAARGVAADPVSTGPTTAPRRSIRRELLDGLRFIAHNPIVLAVFVNAVVINLGAGAIASLNVYFVTENLHAAARWFGILGGAFALGSVAGALAGGIVGDKVGHVRTVTTGLILFGGFVFVYSRLDSVWVAAPVAGLAGAAIGSINAAIAPLMIKTIPREYLGRIFAIITPANRIGSIVSILLASTLVSTVLRNLHATIAGVHIGRIDVVFSVAAMIIVLSGVYFGLTARRQARRDTSSGLPDVKTVQTGRSV
jgi:MFS family permease